MRLGFRLGISGAAIALALAGCGGSVGSARVDADAGSPDAAADAAVGSAGDARADAGSSVEGTIGGVRIVAVDATATVDDGTDGDGRATNGFSIWIGDYAPVCSAGDVAGSHRLILRPSVVGRLAVGTSYTVEKNLRLNQNGLSLAFYSFLNAGCGTASEGQAVAGSIRFDAITPERVRGSFEVSFESGESLRGRFDASICEHPAPGDACRRR